MVELIDYWRCGRSNTNGKTDHSGDVQYNKEHFIYPIFLPWLHIRFLKSSRTFIHSNLALSLILAQLLFLFGINKTQIKVSKPLIRYYSIPVIHPLLSMKVRLVLTWSFEQLVCQIIAAALHYIWLASFVWMALEGVMLYLMLVKVFGSKTLTRKKRFVFLTIGWGKS